MGIDREAVRRQHRHAESRAAARHSVVVLADNVDKSSNLGGILRTAEAFACERVISNRADPEAGGAMGAEHWQPASWNRDLVTEALSYRGNGYSLVVLEQLADALPLDGFSFPRRTILAIGSEVFGVSEEILALADNTVYIPQCGLIKSLNVASATAIALYEYGRQHWMPGYVQPGRHLQPSGDSARTIRLGGG